MIEGRIVVFRPGALGDTIVTVDALAALRARFPSHGLELVGNAQAADMLRASGLIDVATSFDSVEVAALFERPPKVALRWQGAEVVVLWLPRAEPIADAFRETGAERVVAADPHPARAVGAFPASPRGSGAHHPARAVGVTRDVALPRVTSPRGRGAYGLPHAPIHISDHLVQTLRPLGVAANRGAPTLLHSPRASTKPGPGRLALIHPGSGAPRKNWPPDRFAEIARRLMETGWNVRLLRGPADADAVERVSASLGGSPTSIEEPSDVAGLARALASAGVYVGNDSGVSHLSARLGVPTIAVFGPTDPREWAPRGPRVAVVDRAGSWPTADGVWEALLLRV